MPMVVLLIMLFLIKKKSTLTIFHLFSKGPIAVLLPNKTAQLCQNNPVLGKSELEMAMLGSQSYQGSL